MWMTKRKQTGKNITVYASEQTATKMEELKEVNWSQVCKDAIENYVEARKSVNPTVALKFQKLKEGEEREGYMFGSQLAPEILEELSYQELHDLRYIHLDESEFGLLDDPPNPITDWLDDAVNAEKYVLPSDRKKWRKDFDAKAAQKGTIFWVLRLAESKKGLRKNYAFFRGMITALQELLEKAW
jgi:hypothetical protein